MDQHFYNGFIKRAQDYGLTAIEADRLAKTADLKAILDKIRNATGSDSDSAVKVLQENQNQGVQVGKDIMDEAKARAAQIAGVERGALVGGGAGGILGAGAGGLGGYYLGKGLGNMAGGLFSSNDLSEEEKSKKKENWGNTVGILGALAGTGLGGLAGFNGGAHYGAAHFPLN